MESKRKYPRLSYPCALTLWTNTGDQVIMAFTSNIGAGGICVFLNNKISIGTKVEIELELPSRTRVRCFGQVRRCDKENDGLFYKVAFEFTEIAPSDVALIKEQVDIVLAKLNKEG